MEIHRKILTKIEFFFTKIEIFFVNFTPNFSKIWPKSKLFVISKIFGNPKIEIFGKFWPKLNSLRKFRLKLKFFENLSKIGSFSKFSKILNKNFFFRKVYQNRFFLKILQNFRKFFEFFENFENMSEIGIFKFLKILTKIEIFS